jgi:7,8-dihydro-6-hydroxymethylpterin-pyrophosphokinase
MFRLAMQCIQDILSNRILHLDLLSYKQKLGGDEIIIPHIIARQWVFLFKVFLQ